MTKNRLPCSRAVEICDLGGDGPPPDYSLKVGSWKPISKKLEVGSRICKKVGSWKPILEKFGNWKPIWKKNVTWKPILKKLGKLETVFEKLGS